MILPPGNGLQLCSGIYQLTAVEVAELVCALGEAYREYERAFIDKHIDGRFLLKLQEHDIASTLAELGVNDERRAKTLSFLLKSMKELTIVTADVPEDDVEQIDVLFRTGNTLYQQSKFADAKTCYQRTMAGYERAYGTTHPSYLGVVNNFGSLLTEMKLYPEAQEMFEKALAGREVTFGMEHIRTLNTCHHLAEMLKKWSKRYEAMGYFIRCYNGYSVIYGTAHNDTIGARKEVEGLAREMGHLGLKLRREGKMVRPSSVHAMPFPLSSLHAFVPVFLITHLS